MTVDIDDILIAVFLTLSLILIVAWYVAILKWKKRHLAKILPCVKIKTRDRDKSPQDINDFTEYPSVKVISKPNYYDNTQFVDIPIEEIRADPSYKTNNRIIRAGNTDQAKYFFEINSNNNMIIDAKQSRPDLGQSILVNLNNNQGVDQHISNLKIAKEESFRRYNDFIRNQIEEANETYRF